MTESFLDGWTEWWSTVSPEFAFLLALPFALAALVFVVERVRAGRRRRSHPGEVPPRRLSRRAARVHH